MLPSQLGILAKAISKNFQQMLPLIYANIYSCTNQYYQFYLVELRILTAKKHPQMKLQRFRKV